MTVIFDIQEVGLAVTEKVILDKITFQVNQGERVTLVGPSGSGKSSILKLLAGLVSPTQGTILVSEKNLSDLDMVFHRRTVSYCFQQPVLFGKTVKDNLAFPFEIHQLPFDQQKVEASLSSVALSPDFLEKKITELSGGEKQRVALIRNLLFEPEALLLDEVTAGLDAKTKMIVHQLIDNYRKSGKTIIEVTHDQSEIDAAERLITIEGGKLIHDKRLR